MSSTSEERTMIMANAVLNVRSSSPSYVAFDDDALNDLEIAARVVGASGAPTNDGARPLFDDPLVGHSRAPSATRPIPARSMPAKPRGRGGIAAFVVGGAVAVATVATLVFYFAAS